ncbi:RagB/SusD family nutrient uptake outer membrane protein [Segetibacter sp. 3557_3]|uniref:RagB/SusD family nutrient uptake outer membrane protein n=1 Tax=Segetibacter sp. 3557_3 TaxID=2547429 RepID=UPI00105886CC|nr:RagB/SusD family nutrient uptake outer membrane protein [Segetibacter sp. 3557_3]TDH24079.1 RagB/SusD family nutrient uptake outer membrane protein [Segetibacter sp. 3557_3]
MKYFKSIILALVLLTAASCKKLIDIKETDFIDDIKAYQTVENVEQAVIGAYAGLQVEMSYLLNSTFSDEVKTAGEFYNATSTHEWQYSADDVTIRDNFMAVRNYYTIIDRANRVIRAVDKADSTRQGDNNLRLKLRGEALFLRAFCHFELFRYYSDNYNPEGLAMSYMTEPSLAQQARIKMGEYFPKLIADLAEAKTLLPNNLSDVNRTNRIAASGLQARVALYMRDWTNAVTYSTEYINALPLAPRATFPGIWTDANTLEVAFKLKRNNTTNPYGKIGSLYRGTSANASNIGTVTWAPSSKLWDSYDKVNDIRFSTYLKDEPLLATAGRQTRLVQKYAGTAYATPGENVVDAKVFRTAEMYLIRAEAKAELGSLNGPSSAQSDINELRTARIANYNPITYNSKQEAIDDIILERFKELAFEGHRFWDLKRRGLPVIRTGTDAPTPTGATLPAGNFRFLLPIPNSEMQANKLSVQNPGY